MLLLLASCVMAPGPDDHVGPGSCLVSCEDLQQVCLLEGLGHDPLTYEGPALTSSGVPKDLGDTCWCAYQVCEAKCPSQGPAPPECVP